MPCDPTVMNTIANPTDWQFDYNGCTSLQNGTLLVTHNTVSEDEATGQKYHQISYSGTNTSDDDFDGEEMIEVEEVEDVTATPVGSTANINPTKLFLWIAKKVKEKLCPECM